MQNAECRMQNEEIKQSKTSVMSRSLKTVHNAQCTMHNEGIKQSKSSVMSRSRNLRSLISTRDRDSE